MNAVLYTPLIKMWYWSFHPKFPAFLNPDFFSSPSVMCIKLMEESAVRIQKYVRMFLAMRRYQPRLATMPFMCVHLWTFLYPTSWLSILWTSLLPTHCFSRIQGLRDLKQLKEGMPILEELGGKCRISFLLHVWWWLLYFNTLSAPTFHSLLFKKGSQNTGSEGDRFSSFHCPKHWGNKGSHSFHSTCVHFSLFCFFHYSLFIHLPFFSARQEFFTSSLYYFSFPFSPHPLSLSSSLLSFHFTFQSTALSKDIIKKMHSDLDYQMQSLLNELKMRQETQKREEEEAERQRKLKEERERKEREESAVRIQKSVRMFLAMRKYQPRLAAVPFVSVYVCTFLHPTSWPSNTVDLFPFFTSNSFFLFLQDSRIERFEAVEGRDANPWRTRWGMQNLLSVTHVWWCLWYFHISPCFHHSQSSP